jgi:YD repeat-containing protein
VFTRTVRGSAVDSNLSLTTTYAYDGQGRVTDVTDPSGSVTHTDYDREGRVVDVYGDYGAGRLNLRTHYEYDATNRYVTTTEGYGTSGPAFIPRVTRVAYDVLGRRISDTVDPGSGTNPATGKAYLNLTTQYAYDKNSNLVRRRDANGRYTWYVYDQSNRLRFVVDPPNDTVGAALFGRSSVTETRYNAENRVTSVRRFATSVTAPSSSVTELAISTILGQVGSGTAQDQLEVFIYDRDGRQTHLVDAGGTLSFYEYDGNGNVTRRTRYADKAAIGTYYTSASYNAGTGAHSLYLNASVVDTVSVTAGKDRVTTSVYDSFDREAFTIDALGGVTAFTYDSSGNLIASTQYATQDSAVTAATVASWVGSHTSANDRTTRYWYDGAGRLRFTIDAEGWLVEKRYDDSARQSTELVYATKPTVTSTTNLAQLVTIAGQIDGDLDDQITVSQRDAAGRVTSVQDALGNVEYYGYDALDNRIWFTNAKGSAAQDVLYTWRYEYDANGRMVKETTPAVSITTVTTDSSGLHTSAANVALETVMTYDALGNLLTRTEAANTTQARTTTYEYDSMGRQIVTRYPAAEIYDYATSSVVVDSTLYSSTGYDALGNAIWGRDVAGNYSHKGYDALGRIVWEVDAQRYLTFHVRDAFGNLTETRRFAAPRDANVGSATAPTLTYPSSPEVGANDRVLAREYDRLNRVTRVIEPSGYVYDSNLSTGAQGGQATPQTVFLYNAFGDVIRESKLIHGVGAGADPVGPDSNPSAWASTYRYFDRRGQQVAEVDAERYLTRFQYDETGDLIDKMEYANRVASVSVSAIPTAPSATAETGRNRHTIYSYDELNRLTSETFADVEYFDFSSLFQSSLRTGSRATSYGYDAVGNQTRVTVNNASTYSYYDVLGRVIAIAEPRRVIGHSQPVNPQPPTSLTPYQEMYRDAHGNIVKQVRYAGDIGFPTATAKPTVSAALTNDSRNRVTLTRYDLHGHIVESAMANQVSGQPVDFSNATYAVQHAAYTKRGEIAKQWQNIQTVNPDLTPGAPAFISETISSVFHYDALGRQTKLVEAQDATHTRFVESDYNGFGEISERRTLNANGVGVFGRETYEYDNGGRLWRTNADTGVYRVYLYDLAGQATAEIKSQLQDLSSIGSLTLANVLAITAANVMRSETVYDLLGRAVQQRGPTFEILNSAWTVAGSATTRLYQNVDRWGNVTRATDELGRSTDYFYNQMDQMIRAVQPEVDVVETMGGIIWSNPDEAAPRMRPVAFNYYDLYGNLIGKHDPIGFSAATATTGSPPSGAPTYQIKHNEVGQVIKEDANGAQKLYTLDAFGQRIQAVDEMGFKTRYQYDQAGNLIGLAREKGAVAFDAEGYIAPTDFPALQRQLTPIQATGYEVIRYSYDEAGRRIAETTGEFTGASGNTQETIRYWYDLHGNLIRKREPIGQMSFIASDSSTVLVRYETTYEFDVNGNKIKETDGNGSWMTWNYNQFGQLQQHKQLTNANSWVAASLYGSDGDTITYTYDRAGQLDAQVSIFGQDIDYQYDAAGHLRRIVENSTARMQGPTVVLFGVDRDTDYRYDALGLRVGERTVIDGLTHQDSTITYDELDRLKSVIDLRSTITYSYDARGNRTRVVESYLNEYSQTQTHEDWYVYDALNRVTTSGGADSHSTIREVVINATQGTELTYDARGNRATSRTYGLRLLQHNDVDENNNVATWYSEDAGYDEHLYFYDGLSRVITDWRYMDRWVDAELQVSGINGPNGFGTVADERYYDHASRQTQQTTRSVMPSAFGFDVRTTSTTYDDNGRIVRQITGLNGLMESDIGYGTSFYDPGYYWPGDDEGAPGSYSPAGWRAGYDAAGILRGYSVHAYPEGRSSYSTNHSFEYALGDGYLETAHTARSVSTNGTPPPQPGSNKRVYNVNGELVSYFDPADTSGENNRIFATNASGQVLTAVAGNYQYSSNNAWMFTAVLTHEAGSEWSTGNHQLYRFANGQYLGTLGTLQTGSFEANFDTNFEPISSNYPAPVPSQITIQTGDTLRSIAQRVFGDGALWYILADANGLVVDPDTLLDEQVGWSLRVPNEVVSISNNSSSFRPFNVGDALGNTSPVQPAPPPPKASGGGCGIIGQIIVIIVAIVVTYFTAGAASSLMGPVLSAAFGAAVGSVASQLVGIAIGVQEKFSWKAVAVAALTAGLTKGIGVDGLSVIGTNSGSIVNQAINGAISNAIGQGVNIAVGLQDKFSWKDLAMSAVSAPIASRAGNAVGKKIDISFDTEIASNNGFAANFVSGLASGATNVVVRVALGGKVEAVSALADVFGNALGNSMVSSIDAHRKAAAARHNSETEQASAPASTSTSASSEQGQADAFIANFNAKNPNFADRVFPLSVTDPVGADVPSGAPDVPLAGGTEEVLEEIVVTGYKKRAAPGRLGSGEPYRGRYVSGRGSGEPRRGRAPTSNRGWDPRAHIGEIMAMNKPVAPQSGVEIAAEWSRALHFEQAYAKNSWDIANAEASNPNNPWYVRAGFFGLQFLETPLMVAEEIGRGIANIPSGVLGAIPLADQGNQAVGTLFSSSASFDDRVIGGLSAARDYSFATLGILAPFALGSGAVSGEMQTLRPAYTQMPSSAEMEAIYATYRSAPVSRLDDAAGEFATFYHGTSQYTAAEVLENQAINLERLAEHQSGKSFNSGLYTTTQESTANYYADLLFARGRAGGPATLKIEVPQKSFSDFAQSRGIAIETPVPRLPGQTETFIPMQHLNDFNLIPGIKYSLQQ